MAKTKITKFRSLQSIQCKKLKAFPNAKTCTVTYANGKKKVVVGATDKAIVNFRLNGHKRIGNISVKAKPGNKIECEIETKNVYWSDGKDKMFPTTVNIYCWRK